MIDTHAHFYSPNYTASEMEAHLSSNPDLTVIVTPETLLDAEQVVKLCGQFAGLRACVGLHPVQPVQRIHSIDSEEHAHSAEQPYPNRLLSPSIVDAQMAALDALISSNRACVVAVGEVGLDFSPWLLESECKQYPTKTVDSIKQDQRDAFSKLISLAQRHSLPVNVHSRNAGHHAIAVLKQANMLNRSLLHAFDGSKKHALNAAKEGALFSVSGIIARDQSIRNLVQALPLSSLCLESDAPSLSPVKGERSWPAESLRVAAQAIADIKDIPLDDVFRITSENAARLFGLDLASSK
ncbi:putative deoxyribonuclease tatdn3 [Chytriomyces hyalinus]|nr:putative deoxyribonuclease tatdn3 [Chytriomyces hyalinus]